MRLTRGWQGAAGEDPWGEPPAPIALRWEVVTFREHFNPGHRAGRRTWRAAAGAAPAAPRPPAARTDDLVPSTTRREGKRETVGGASGR